MESPGRVTTLPFPSIGQVIRTSPLSLAEAYSLTCVVAVERMEIPDAGRPLAWICFVGANNWEQFCRHLHQRQQLKDLPFAEMGEYPLKHAASFMQLSLFSRPL